MAPLLRLTLASGSGAMLDLAVPPQVPVADVLAAALPGVAGPVRLATAVGRALELDRSFGEQGLRDGDVVALVEEGVTLPVDDPADALAREVTESVLGWDARLLRPTAIVGVTVLLGLAGAALSLGPGWCGAIAAGAAVLLGVAAARLDDRLLVLVAAWVAVGFAAVAGWHLAGAPAAGFAAAVSGGCLVVPLRRLGVLLLPAVGAGVLLGCVGATAVWGTVSTALVVSVVLVLGVLVTAGMPGLVLAACRHRPAPARELLRAGQVGLAVVFVVLAAVAGASSGPAAGVAFAAGLVTGCRCTRQHGAADIILGLSSALATLVATVAGMLVARSPLCGVAGVVALGVACAGAVAASAVHRGGAGDPRLPLTVDRIEAVLLVAIVPLAAVACGALPAVRALVGS